MKNIKKVEPIFRSPLISAGNNEKYIKKAFSSNADCLVLDLEDGVPAEQKEIARKTIKSVLNSDLIDQRPVFVRVNSLETGLTYDDIDSVACENLSGFLYTKPYTAGDIIIFDNMITEIEKKHNLELGSLKIIIIIETPSSVLNAFEIAKASKRNIGLLYGAEDLLGDMHGYHGPFGRPLHMSRSQVLLAARAAGLVAIDTPYIQVKNLEGFKEFIIPSLELGYDGILLISPSQIEIANKMYTPPKEEVEKAYKMVELEKETYKTGKGVSLHNKLFISPPTLKRAKNLLKRYEKIVAFEKALNKK